jgi:hypothetical protein
MYVVSIEGFTMRVYTGVRLRDGTQLWPRDSDNPCPDVIVSECSYLAMQYDLPHAGATHQAPASVARFSTACLRTLDSVKAACTRFPKASSLGSLQAPHGRSQNVDSVLATSNSFPCPFLSVVATLRRRQPLCLLRFYRRQELQ